MKYYLKVQFVDLRAKSCGCESSLHKVKPPTLPPSNRKRPFLLPQLLEHKLCLPLITIGIPTVDPGPSLGRLWVQNQVLERIQGSGFKK